MWQFKHFPTQAALLEWVDARAGRIQWNAIFVNNGYAVEYRNLRIICADHGIENVA